MEFQENNDTQKNHTQTSRSETMALASMILGIVALLTSACIYLSVICGSLGIILALISRGSEQTLSLHSKVGLILSIAGLLMTFFIYLSAILYILLKYGGTEEFLQQYSDLYQSMGIQQF